MNRSKDSGYYLNGNAYNLLMITGMVVLLLMAGCEKKTYERIESTWPDGTTQWIRYYETEAMDNAISEIRFFESGAKRIAGPLKNGVRHGKWQAWYEDGTLWSEGTYKNGKENGVKTVYFENGKKYYEGQVKDDERIGIWKFWDEEGNLVKEVNYDQQD